MIILKWSKFLLLFGVLFFQFIISSAHDPSDWEFYPIPRVRTVNSIQILDQNTIILAGGNETNDAIRTVLISMDGGQNWNFALDSIHASWMKSVYFVNSSTGFVVGSAGAIMKTTNGGVAWSSLSVPAGVSTRNFNSIFFINSQVGYIAGGNRSNDSIQTILKTVDGGNNWTIQRDALGHWLKAIYFTDQNNGFAVGVKGVALKTTDGGNNWSQVTLPGNTSTRDFNTVFFTDSTTGFLGGGNKSLDSIQTMLRTTDGGGTWNIISDNLGPWITSIYFPVQFPTSSTGFAVGDYGTALITQNGGNTWSPVGIPGTVNDSVRALHSVFFLNLDFGVAAGALGKMLIYKASVSTVPSATTSFATNIKLHSATLNGQVNANGTATQVTFEYGTTPAFGSSINAVPNSVSGILQTQVSSDISGLDSNTTYYYRTKAFNNSGISYGDTKQFYAGSNPIPNFDFEFWHFISEFVPQHWVSIGGVSQVASYDGSSAALLSHKPMTEADDVGVVLFGLAGEQQFLGGVPFAARPDSLIGYFNYNIAPGDSGLIVLFLKKNGIFNSQNFYHITGNSNGNFQRFSFPITYTNSDVPDSLILGLVNSDPFSEPMDTNSYFAVDNISFSGTTLNVPNYDFEMWETKTGEVLDNWLSSGYDDPIGIFPLILLKETDKQHGSYAAKLENRVSPERKLSRLISGNTPNNYSQPTFAIHSRYLTFNGYLKFFPQGGDTATITVTMFKNGVILSHSSIFVDSIVADYTPFFTTFNYPDPNMVPDSALILISAGGNNNNVNGSILYIDNLGFDGFYEAPNLAVRTKEFVFSKSLFSWNIYPNPAQNNVLLKLLSNEQEAATVSIFDLSGKTIKTMQVDVPGYGNAVEHSIDIETIGSGYYIVMLNHQRGREFKKLVIAK